MTDDPARIDGAPRVDPSGRFHVRGSAIVVLAVAIAVGLGFAFVRGGLTYPLQPRPGSGVSAPSATAIPSPSPSGSDVAVAMSPASSPAQSPLPSPSPSPSASPAPSRTPPATATARPTARPTPPTSDRYAVLRRCPDAPRCWIYTIRSGDNLFSIAHWFGVSLDAIHAMNPWTLTTGIRAGQDLRIPPPTR